MAASSFTLYQTLDVQIDLHISTGCAASGMHSAENKTELYTHQMMSGSLYFRRQIKHQFLDTPIVKEYQ